MTVLNVEPRLWSYMLDALTQVDDDAAWMWRLKVCRQLTSSPTPQGSASEPSGGKPA